MNLSINKTLLVSALAASLGVSSAASAATVDFWQLTDYNNDGLESDFNFFSAPAGDGPNQFTGDVGPIVMGVENPAGSFSTGFNFGGTGQFVPFVANPTGTGSATADITAGVLTFTALDFGGEFGGVNFYLPPDGGAGTVTVEDITNLGSGDWGVVVRYVGTIDEPSSPFNGFAANWRLEGVMSVAPVPVPAAVWLFGSGLLGLVGVARRKRKHV